MGIQLVPKNCFLQILSIGRSNQKNSKNKVHLFFNFASGRTLLTQSTGPQPIQLVPNPFNWSPNTVFFTDISVSVAQIIFFLNPFIFEICFWKDPPHPVNCPP